MRKTTNQKDPFRKRPTPIMFEEWQLEETARLIDARKIKSRNDFMRDAMTKALAELGIVPPTPKAA